MQIKIIKLLPFIILFIVTINTFIGFIFIENVSTIFHYLAIICILINLIAYFKNFDFGIALTGIILLLGTFNLLAFFTDIEYSSFSFFIKINDENRKISTPKVHFEFFLFFILYLILNRKTFVNQIKIYIKRSKSL